MKVKKLIELLKVKDQESEVVVNSPNQGFMICDCLDVITIEEDRDYVGHYIPYCDDPDTKAINAVLLTYEI